MKTTTTEGFLMNTLRRIPRHMVRALAAGAVLVAAALPMAMASVASAAGTDAITGVAYSISGGITSQAYFGTGASGTFDVAGTFAGDGGNTAVTTTAPGVTFTVLANTTGADITGTFASTSATVPGSYSITVTDNGGTATQSAAFTVYGDPTVTSATPSSLPDTVSPGATTITIAGGGFVADAISANPVVTFTSTVDGTSLWVASPAGGGATEITPTSSITASVTPVNSLHHTIPATPGTYTVTVTNADGGSFTSGPIFTILGNEISTVSPSAILIPGAAGSTTTAITISGGGFQSGATVALGTCVGVTLSGASVTSGSTITASVVVTNPTASATRCDITVTNNGSGGNGASYTAVGALGIGEGSSLAPSITASSLTAATALVAGAPSTTITFTGVGFSSFTTPVASTYGPANAADAAAVVGTGCIANSAGTSLTCPIQVNTGSFAGPHTANLENTSGNTASTGSLANSFAVDGPSITSASPTALAVGAPVGTVVALTGTGFNNTTQGTVTHVSSGVLAGSFQYVSATTENFVVTTPPTIADNGDTLSVHSTDAYGAVENSAPFAIGVDAAPIVTSITYATGTTGVGAGATAQAITINGTGFRAGATVTGFTNAASVADAAVTVKVTAVNNLGTQITATVAIAATDVNTIDGYLVTNTDGGVARAFPVAPAGLTIDAGPTVTAVSPSPVLASATNAVTITGTGFRAGAVVTATVGATCGVATVVSATSITVSCTFGVAQSTASSLVVTNLDGGSATSAAVLPAATPPPVKKPVLRVTAVRGVARIGHTVTITLIGTGFYGQPKITSTAKGTKAVVFRDTGKALQLHVTVTSKLAKGMHTFTIRLANGKTCKANYRTV